MWNECGNKIYVKIFVLNISFKQVFYTSLYEKTLGPQIGPLMIVGTTVLQLIGNVLAILYMDKSGRRKMMQISLVGMVLTTLLKFGNDIFYFVVIVITIIHYLFIYLL